MTDQTEILISDEEFDALMREDLMVFLIRTFLELNPGAEFSHAPHLEVIAAKLASTLRGKGPKRLIINLPPRSLKSIAVSVAFVAWVLGHDPTKQVICASYGQDLADKLGRDTRQVMMGSSYHRVFPATRIAPNKTSASDFATTRSSGRMATSVTGVLTGRGGDIIVIDDPLKPAEAHSESARNAVNEWYDNTLLSRLNNKEEGIIIIVMQRLHPDDLVGYLLSRGEQWDVLSFAAIAEEDEEIIVETASGKFTFKRKAGEVLDPTRESLETLLGLKKSIGAHNFSSQYQQDPQPIAGNMILREWIPRYDPAAPLPTFTSTLMSLDTANKSGELNDFSVCTLWGVFAAKYYLLGVWRQRLIYPDLLRKIIELIEQHKPSSVLIEDRASGTQLIQDLKSKGHFGIKPYQPPPATDKTMRLNNVSALFEGGQVLLPLTAPWLHEYERELFSFPNCRYFDQVDSTTQALAHMRSNRALDTWIALGGIHI